MGGIRVHAVGRRQFSGTREWGGGGREGGGAQVSNIRFIRV